jgi:hypothetical protein
MRRFSVVNELGPVGREARRLPDRDGDCHRCGAYCHGDGRERSVLVKHGARFHRVCADRAGCRARIQGQGSFEEIDPL